VLPPAKSTQQLKRVYDEGIDEELRSMMGEERRYSSWGWSGTIDVLVGGGRRSWSRRRILALGLCCVISTPPATILPKYLKSILSTPPLSHKILDDGQDV
jgi:hypothetical protein